MKDNPGSASPLQFTVMGNRVFFTTEHPLYDREIWSTDGTDAGTLLLKDINPRHGDGRGQPPSSRLLTPAGQQLFFLADDDISGRELWTSDGTGPGTHLVKDISPGTSVVDSDMVALNGAVYFVACQEACTLWRSDGTESGTYSISHPAWTNNISELTAACGALFFTNDDGIHGRELWRSDGTASGTAMVADISLAPGASSFPTYVTRSGERIYFIANDGRGGALWRSDGTSAGTTLVAPVPSPVSIAPLGDGVVVVAGDDATGREPWISDGTPEGTRLLRDIRPGPEGSFPGSVDLVPVGGRLVFRADDGQSGEELWVTDGTEDGTRLLYDINPGPEWSYPQTFASFGALTLFRADDGINGIEMWMSDGTEAGTRFVADVDYGPASGQPFGFAVLGDRIVFSAYGGPPVGTELFAIPYVIKR